MTTCFRCAAPLTAALVTKICIPIDLGEGQVTSLVVCAACAPYAPTSDFLLTLGAQTFLDAVAKPIRRYLVRP